MMSTALMTAVPSRSFWSKVSSSSLVRAAAAGNRSLSQETEHRIRRGLDDDATISSFWGDAKTFAIMRLAAQVIQSLDEVSHAKVHWTADPKPFDAAINAIAGTLKLFRPLQSEDLSVASPEIGVPALKIVAEAQAAELSRPLNKSSKRHRAMGRFKEDLGQELADRVIERTHGQGGRNRAKDDT
jgi:hypothetical protein